MSQVIKGEDGIIRCRWAGMAPDFPDYHDHEWGFPVDDDIRLFEKLCLEAFQCGLSWRTILSKRENFREAFYHFDFTQIAKFTKRDVNRLLKDEGIVRNRSKIEATVINARAALQLLESENSLAAFLWRYEPAKPLTKPQSLTKSPESIALSKDLKKRGWSFVGPTTVFAFMQSVGMLNDHVKRCASRDKVERARKKFKRPV